MARLGPLVRVSRAEILEDFTAKITFEDGTQREIDLEPYLHGPIFEEIRRDRSMLRAVKIEGGTIAWNNGADIDPDVLYYNLKPAWLEDSEGSGREAQEEQSR